MNTNQLKTYKSELEQTPMEKYKFIGITAELMIDYDKPEDVAEFARNFFDIRPEQGDSVGEVIAKTIVTIENSGKGPDDMTVPDEMRERLLEEVNEGIRMLQK